MATPPARPGISLGRHTVHPQTAAGLLVLHAAAALIMAVSRQAPPRRKQGGKAMRRGLLILIPIAGLLGTPVGAEAQSALAYAFNAQSKDVTIIDTTTNASIATKPLGAAVKWLSNEQDFFDGRLAWTYEDLADGAVDVIAIDLQEMRVVHRVRAGRGLAHSVILTPDKRRAIVNVAGDDKLVVVDTQTATIVKQVPVGKFPCDLDRTADGRLAYLPERDQDTVAAIDLQSLQVVKRVPMGEGTHPHMLRLSPDGRTVWVQNARENTNVILDSQTLDKLATIPVGRVPVTNAFTPDGRYGYITHFEDNFVSVVDTRSFKEVSRIKVAQGLAVITFRPDGRFAYVAAKEAQAVGVIDVAQQKLDRLIPAGKQPWGLIVSPERR